MGYPSVYPTGTTVYNPEKAWSGYTIYVANELGALLIDMNGREINLWKGLRGSPNKLLPGGYVLGSRGERNSLYGWQDRVDLIQVDWEGNVVWEFNKKEYVEDPDEKPQWMARQHHDYQRQGNPVGYYSPELTSEVLGGNTLILCHEELYNHKISDKKLLDDCIIEVDWDGNILWKWNANEHFNEYEFNEDAKNVLFRNPTVRKPMNVADWLHINSMSALGPNKWYDNGDERFNPNNIIWCSREANMICIISKETGKVVWKIGPHYDDKKYKDIGQIIGQHHAHMIPAGLPGAGDILVFDNGGWAGYGASNTMSKDGHHNCKREYSRVLEIDPTTLKIVWQYTAKEAGYQMPFLANHFFSPFISSAQRLPNGNTLITEGADGRIIEVTSEHELVWEYISPYWGEGQFQINRVYRAYRVPYDWVPQVEKPQEVAMERLDVKTYRLPGAAALGRDKITTIAGVKDYGEAEDFCVEAEK